MGVITESLALALDKLGVEVQIKPAAIWYDHNSLKPRTQELVKNELKNIDFELLIMYPVYSFDGINKNAALLSMWEADKLPSVWIKAINSLNLPVLAPSKFSADVFRNSGVKVPVIDFPLGVDKEFYEYRERIFPTDRPFRFLSIGKFEPRKNGNTLLRCFNRTFPGRDDIELYIKTRERFIPSDSGRSASTQIKFFSKTVSEKELRELYYSCNAFVYPSRGEAFSFPPRNAILTGMPTLVTNWSALAEIPGARLIMTKGLSPMFKCGFSYGEEANLLMADIDEEHLCKLFEKMLDKTWYEAECDDVKSERDTHLSWDDCAKNLIKYVEGN
jgi:glycosyltransferase involved in cell wall biosynthesis